MSIFQVLTPFEIFCVFEIVAVGLVMWGERSKPEKRASSSVSTQLSHLEKYPVKVRTETVLSAYRILMLRCQQLHEPGSCCPWNPFVLLGVGDESWQPISQKSWTQAGWRNRSCCERKISIKLHRWNREAKSFSLKENDSVVRGEREKRMFKTDIGNSRVNRE